MKVTVTADLRLSREKGPSARQWFCSDCVAFEIPPVCKAGMLAWPDCKVHRSTTETSVHARSAREQGLFISQGNLLSLLQVFCVDRK